MKSNLLRKHKKKYESQRKRFRNFITRAEKKLDHKSRGMVEAAEEAAWQQVDCLSCANCCKQMSPTYSTKDIKRIAAFLGMSSAAFKKKWLYFDKKEKDWMNVSQPCQFLDLKTNKCSVYEVRPADCADFPHLNKRPYKDYFYIHSQNIEYCPATIAMIEKMHQLMSPKT